MQGQGLSRAAIAGQRPKQRRGDGHGRAGAGASAGINWCFFGQVGSHADEGAFIGEIGGAIVAAAEDTVLDGQGVTCIVLDRAGSAAGQVTGEGAVPQRHGAIVKNGVAARSGVVSVDRAVDQGHRSCTGVLDR